MSSARLWLSLAVILATAVCQAGTGRTNERHVVIVVWDGMRPDFVSAETTPTLWKLAREGVLFRNHHSVYPSATNVNGTAIATGNYPGHSGILANHVYRPGIDPLKSIDVESAAVVQKGDEISGGKYIAVATLPELVRRAGRTTAVATAKTVGLLYDRHFASANAGKSAMLFAGTSLPPDAIGPIARTLGRFQSVLGASEHDQWTTRALTDFFWRDELPAFSLLWLSEPDDTEHKTAPGAPAALAAIKSSDDNLARVLAALDRPGSGRARESTDIFVVSDHGFSTIAREIELPKILHEAGFGVVTQFSAPPQAGEIMMAGNGGSVLFYVTNHDGSTTRRLVDFLQQSDFSGVILTRQSMDGTFTLDAVGMENATAPDVVLAFHWTDRENQFGRPGMIDADWQRAAGKGTHATLSRYDMHNTLVAAGPDFRRGLVSERPSGNVDLAPTIARILKIEAPAMDGRVLTEALSNGPDAIARVESNTIEATNEFPIGKWRQYLRTSRVGSTLYLDEGNGEFVATKTEND
jgi:arylsulfatase A-like enzyme